MAVSWKSVFKKHRLLILNIRSIIICSSSSFPKLPLCTRKHPISSCENLSKRSILHRIRNFAPRERASAGIDCANIAARAHRQLSGARKQKISMPANTVMRYTPWAHIMGTNVGKHLLGRP